MKDQLVTSLQGALRPDEINCGIKVILKKRKEKTLPLSFIQSFIYFLEKAEYVEIVILKCFASRKSHLNETHYAQNTSSNKRSTRLLEGLIK